MAIAWLRAQFAEGEAIMTAERFRQIKQVFRRRWMSLRR